ncbi:hypothetical protein BGZ60DRAFT_406572 [Tricladium varicosporioides]|nr:hypothetical protein BGZ60DRAFT_406572 [Hymenoscyphus varicosporioides]
MCLSEEDRKFVLVADEELQQYLYAIMAAQTIGPLNTTELGLFLDNHFQKSNKSVPPSIMPRCQDTLDYMSRTLEAVDFFVEFCILIFAKAYGAPSAPNRVIGSVIFGRPAEEQARLLSTSLPLSMWSDKRRIRRALLRFQLYCELFHQPGDGSESVSDWEERLQEQEVFWLCYEWWEVEEVKCIYQVLVFCLENASEGGSLHSGQVLEANGQQRGLTQLRYFLDNSIGCPTAFGEGYLRRFLARPFHGFQQADPDDYSYFSLPRPAYMQHFIAAGVQPDRTYRTLFHKYENFRYVVSQGPGRNRKWMPSPYPGVQLEYFNSRNCVPAECRGIFGDEKAIRQFLRLIGWVFWSRDKLYDWVEFGKSFEVFRLEAGDLDEDWDAPRGLYRRKPFRWTDYENEHY